MALISACAVGSLCEVTMFQPRPTIIFPCTIMASNGPPLSLRMPRSANRIAWRISSLFVIPSGISPAAAKQPKQQRQHNANQQAGGEREIEAVIAATHLDVA